MQKQIQLEGWYIDEKHAKTTWPPWGCMEHVAI